MNKGKRSALEQKVHDTKNFFPRFGRWVTQGPKLRLPGRQCDYKFSPGDQNFIAGRQLATCKAGCYC